jgi:hypothetical protein
MTAITMDAAASLAGERFSSDAGNAGNTENATPRSVCNLI